MADSTEVSSTSSPTTVSHQSFLSQLRAPTASDIMRKRKVRTNNPPRTGARRKTPKCSTDPKNFSASDRAKEFNNEMIVVSCGKLFCSACREELSLKLSIIKNHVQSSKHADSKSKMGSAKKRERDISDALNLYEKEVNPSGSRVP